MFKKHSEQQEVGNTAHQEACIEKSVPHSCNIFCFSCWFAHNRASYLAISFAEKNPVL